MLQLASLGYRTDLALLQLGGTHVDDHGDHLVVSSPHIPSYWWGNFLLLAEVPPPAEAQGWLDRFGAAFPEAKHVALGFDGTAGRISELSWFAEHGFHAEALTVMTATAVHEPAHTNRDAAYRELRSDDDWAQSVELQVRSARTEIGTPASRDFAVEKARVNRGLVEAGHGGWFGAFLAGQLAAQMGLLAAGQGLARFQSVETDPDFRRQGLAGTLVHHVSRHGFSELGARTLVMVADPDYFAIDLYRRVGFEPTETQLIAERKPQGE